MDAVIMGGTAGIGRATAERLTKDGMTVTVTGRDPDRLTAMSGLVAATAQLDGTDYEAVAAFFAEQGEFDHLVLAFSPGAVAAGELRTVGLADIETAFSGKLFGYLNAIKHAHVTASITMVSAASARAALPGTVSLAAVNGAVERIVPPLAAELAPVRVNAVAPGVVDTDWWSFLPEDQRAAQFESAAAGVPTGRIATATDVADAIAYLTGAAQVTGTVLPVDGGLTAA